MDPLRKIFESSNRYLEDLKAQIVLTTKALSHDPLLQMIGKNRLMIENLQDEVKKLKDTEGRNSLSQHLHKVEATLNMTKNDLQ